MKVSIDVPFRFKRRNSKDTGMTEDLTAQEMYDDREAIIDDFTNMEKWKVEGEDVSFAPWIIAMTKFVEAWENALPE